MVMGPHGPYIPARSQRVTEAVGAREYSPSGMIQREWLATRTTETRDLGGLAAEMPAPWWYRAWLRCCEVVVVAAAWLVWLATLGFVAGVLVVGAIHIWGPAGVWLAAAAMFLVWWCSLVRRAWREQDGRDRGRTG